MDYTVLCTSFEGGDPFAKTQVKTRDALLRPASSPSLGGEVAGQGSPTSSSLGCEQHTWPHYIRHKSQPRPHPELPKPLPALAGPGKDGTRICGTFGVAAPQQGDNCDTFPTENCE